MKTLTQLPKEKAIHGARLLVYRNKATKEPKADSLWATLFPTNSPDADHYDGKEVQLYDWKWDKESGTIYVRGSIYMGCGSYNEINGTFPASLETTDLPKPGRNFEWDGFFGEWRNVKTGERRKP